MNAIPAIMKHTVVHVLPIIITIVITPVSRVAQLKQDTTQLPFQEWSTVLVAMTKLYARAVLIPVQMAVQSVLLECLKEEHVKLLAAIIITTSHRILSALIVIFHVTDAQALQ